LISTQTFAWAARMWFAIARFVAEFRVSS